MKRIYNFHIDRLTKWLVPDDLEQPKNMSFVRALMWHLKEIYRDFKAKQAKRRYELEHGEHVAELEAVLNDAFDRAFRRIKIVDAPDQYEPIYIFQDAEQKPVAIFIDTENQPKKLNTDFEVEFAGIDFVVQVPYSIPYDTAKMNALVEKYKTPGMVYIIEETL